MLKLSKKELEVLQTPNNYLEEVQILKKLYNLGFIKWIPTDYTWRLFAKVWITDEWQKYLEEKRNAFNFLNKFEISINLWIFNIKKK